MNADSKDLVIITGANQGGKSTFLRSIGVSQLMMRIADVAEDFATVGQYGAGSAVEKIAQEREEAFNRH